MWIQGFQSRLVRFLCVGDKSRRAARWGEFVAVSGKACHWLSALQWWPVYHCEGFPAHPTGVARLIFPWKNNLKFSGSVDNLQIVPSSPEFGVLEDNGLNLSGRSCFRVDILSHRTC